MARHAAALRRLLLAAFLALGLATIVPARAAAPDDAAGFVRDLGAASIAMLRDPTLGSAERQARFGQLVEGGFDLATIARLALGSRWRTLAAADRDAYVRLFRAYVLDVYAHRLEDYRDQGLRVGEVVTVGQDKLVESWIEGGGEPVRVDWRVRATPAGPRIVDVVVAGVSMVLTQRSEFASIIERQGGVPGLMAHLRRRVEGGRQRAG